MADSDALFYWLLVIGTYSRNIMITIPKIPRWIINGITYRNFKLFVMWFTGSQKNTQEVMKIFIIHKNSHVLTKFLVPRKHKKPLMVRGFSLPWKFYFLAFFGRRTMSPFTSSGAAVFLSYTSAVNFLVTGSLPVPRIRWLSPPSS